MRRKQVEDHYQVQIRFDTTRRENQSWLTYAYAYAWDSKRCQYDECYCATGVGRADTGRASQQLALADVGETLESIRGQLGKKAVAPNNDTEIVYEVRIAHDETPADYFDTLEAAWYAAYRTCVEHMHTEGYSSVVKRRITKSGLRFSATPRKASLPGIAVYVAPYFRGSAE